jgi:tungstate transport system substrate-binding protein
MAETLRIADEKEGYTLSDGSTFLALERRLRLKALRKGDPALLNIYSVIELNPERLPKVNDAGGRAFSAFLQREPGMKMILEFGREKYGRSLFQRYEPPKK